MEGKRTLPAFLQIGIAWENLSLEAKDIVKIIIGFDKSRAKKEKKKPKKIPIINPSSYPLCNLNVFVFYMLEWIGKYVIPELFHPHFSNLCWEGELALVDWEEVERRPFVHQHFDLMHLKRVLLNFYLCLEKSI